MRIPAKVSVKRPFTSASIFPRSLKTGRTTEKALIATTAKSAKGAKLNNVKGGLIRISKTKATTAVNNPPINCTRPVPTKLFTPSTSFITLETSAPLWVLSKKRTGSDKTLRCTSARSSVIRYCACTLTSFVSMKLVTA